MRLLISSLWILAISAGAATAAEAPPMYSTEYRSCMSKAGPYADPIDACVKAETANQDKALNEAYSRLQTRLSTYQKEALTTSERAWIKFRDAECDFHGSVLIGGPLGIEERAQKEARANCVLHETYLRSQSLKNAASESWDGTR